ncbi:MAG: lipoyl synthase [Candidatus Krumholzibacteriota bacterium]|nr:lipoyl synthase [Candidatus Krumholzibacteriota bacterium]
MILTAGSSGTKRLPPWLRRNIPVLSESSRIEGTIKKHHLHTICHEGLCPNRAECYSRGKVTFMMLGDICTRGCRFCSVGKGKPEKPDEGEPARIAAAARELGLNHVIVTSVTRDDLPDGGARLYARMIGELRKLDSPPVVEVLVPDFGGNRTALDTVLEASPDIFSHNLETVRRLYPEIRRGADYDRSLRLLNEAKKRNREVKTKSSFMLGLGETREEILEALEDLRATGCDFLALGQYLRPGREQVPVREYISPESFSVLEERGYDIGFLEVTAGPLVRSSYQENRLDALSMGNSGAPDNDARRNAR